MNYSVTVTIDGQTHAVIVEAGGGAEAVICAIERVAPGLLDIEGAEVESWTVTENPATSAQVRRHFQGLGIQVRISRDGRIRFRRDWVGPWLEGRNVSEYRIFEGEVFHI